MNDAGWTELERDGTRLAVRDFGGAGPTVLLLHGLGGHAGEWAATAAALTAKHRVLAPDARGHGRSERHPADVTREACAADVVHVAARLDCDSVALVGQSLGGHTALLVAAAQPALVRALVVAEASPLAADDAAGFAADLAATLRRWPVPFGAREDAVAFFAGRGWSPGAAEAWADGLELRADGWRPGFEVGTMERMLHEAVARDRWDAWERIACPVLVVRGEHGTLARETADEMARRTTGARAVEIADAGHDVHLDQPEAWRTTLARFLADVG